MLPICKHMVCRPVAFQSSGLAKGSSDKPAPAAEVKMEIKQEAPLGPTAGLGATAGLGVTAGIGSTAGLGSTAGMGSTAGLGAGSTAGGPREAPPRVPLHGIWRLSDSRSQQSQPPKELAALSALAARAAGCRSQPASTAMTALAVSCRCASQSPVRKYRCLPAAVLLQVCLSCDDRGPA